VVPDEWQTACHCPFMRIAQDNLMQVTAWFKESTSKRTAPDAGAEESTAVTS
jgi:hypothetical protein